MIASPLLPREAPYTITAYDGNEALEQYHGPFIIDAIEALSGTLDRPMTNNEISSMLTSLRYSGQASFEGMTLKLSGGRTLHA